jgi:hypothetical protein
MPGRSLMRRGGYTGPVDVLLDGTPVGTITVDLIGYGDVLVAGHRQDESPIRWNGEIVDGQRPVAVGTLINLRTLDGRVGAARFTSGRTLTGHGPAPFHT